MGISESLTNAKKWVLGIRTAQEAEEGIHRDTVMQNAMHVWAKRTRNIAIGLTAFAIFARAGVFIGAAGVAWGVFGVVKGTSYLIDCDIKRKREAEQQMRAEEAAKAPKPAVAPKGPSMVKKATAGFTAANVNTAKPVATPAPAAPAQKTFWNRIGL